MIETIVKAAVDLKIPTIVIISITFATGAYLVIQGKNQAATLAGCGILGLGGVGMILSFADNLVKERYESIINHYEKALHNISKTHSTIEQTSRTNITTQAGGDQLGNAAYQREQPSTTPSR